jgi:hypothetical protein
MFRFDRTPRPLLLKACFGCFAQSRYTEGWHGQHGVGRAFLIRSPRINKAAKGSPLINSAAA